MGSAVTAWVVTFLVLTGVGVFGLMRSTNRNAQRAYFCFLGGGAFALAKLIYTLAGKNTLFAAVLTLALISLWAAIRVITHQKSVYSALYFILIIIATSGMMILMQAEFLAMATIIIYAGAILVTYLFVIMLAQKPGVANADSQSRAPFFALFCGFLILSMILVRLLAAPQILGEPSPAKESLDLIGTATRLGKALMTDYLMALQIAGVLLTAAMVGAIAVAQRKMSAAGAEMDNDE